jgi:hypothetical protein
MRSSESGRFRPSIGVVLSIAIVTLGACGPSPGGSNEPIRATATGGATVAGTVEGHLLARPCSGGPESVTSPCAGVPVAGAQIDIEVAGGTSLAVAITAADGSFSFETAVGQYTVTVEGRTFYVDKQPRALTVTAGSTTTIDLVVDSGLR